MSRTIRRNLGVLMGLPALALAYWMTLDDNHTYTPETIETQTATGIDPPSGEASINDALPELDRVDDRSGVSVQDLPAVLDPGALDQVGKRDQEGAHSQPLNTVTDEVGDIASGANVASAKAVSVDDPKKDASSEQPPEALQNEETLQGQDPLQRDVVIASNALDADTGEADGVNADGPDAPAITAEERSATDRDAQDYEITDIIPLQDEALISEVDDLIDDDVVQGEGESEKSSSDQLTDPVFIALDRVEIFERNRRIMAQSLSPEDTIYVARRGTPSEEALRFPYKIMPAEWIKSNAPVDYPALCRAVAADREAVTIRFRVTHTGRADRLAIASGSNDCFNKAARQTVRNMRFHVRAPAGFGLGGSFFLISVVFEKPALDS